ncbi:MAG: hypothetical protein PHN39_02870 [Candidatus Pacebacteria bacterium]|nr:hypothetical protein [Candidatus Paceibacterota bacterium]
MSLDVITNNGSLISLIGFLVILILYLWYTFAIVYHFVRFGVGVRPKVLAFVFLVGSFILFVLMVDAYFTVDWTSLIETIITPPV